jgi:adhesin HecA-like repeat protein
VAAFLLIDLVGGTRLYAALDNRAGALVTAGSTARVSVGD